MKKQTISALLTAFMILLVILIVVLVIKIAARGPKQEEAIASENTIVEQTNTVSEDEPDAAETVDEVKILVAVPNTSSSVNVRSGPGTDYERLGSAYSNNEYEVIEVYSNGWTKLKYDDQEGYISSEYLQYNYKTVDSEGNESYNAVEITELMMSEYQGSEPVPSTSENETTSDNAVTTQ
ncbi:MAG TPA: SH3 domain-containing protein [Lachnospiraceae bacterium]|nr:SH3 domain-containing protein [Lachnospiraceae bacterium]